MSSFALFPALGVALGLLVGLAAHEFVTHLIAARLGDPSPRFQQRISLDLRKHADPLGTYVAPILFVVVTLLGTAPAFYFAFGRAHALQGAYQRPPAKRLVLSAISGPLVMLLLAAFALRFSDLSVDVGTMFFYAALALLHMTAVELLPMPGRDGGRILARFLSPQVALKYEELRQYEALFVIGVYLLFPGAVQNLAAFLGDLIT